MGAKKVKVNRPAYLSGKLMFCSLQERWVVNNRRGAASRVAMTLVELLVSITIVGIVASLLLVGVSHVRESSRRLQCGNRLRQIGLAVQNYQSTHKVMPRGFGANGFSPLVAIMPYLELQSVYNTIDFSGSSLDNSMGPAFNTPIAAFRCPSTGEPAQARTDYSLNRGTRLATGKENGPFLYVGEDGYLSSARLSNGTSNTVLFSEYGPLSLTVRGRPFQLPKQSVSTSVEEQRFIQDCREALRDGKYAPLDNGRSWSNASLMFYHHIFTPNFKSCANGTSNSRSIFTTFSVHPDGVNSVFADGHVEFVPSAIDGNAWRLRGTR